MKLHLSMCVCLGLVLFSDVQASPLATDSYLIGTDPTAGEYEENVRLLVQPGNLANQGFATGPYNQGSGTSQFVATSSGLEYVPLGETTATSGKVTYNAAPIDAFTRSNARALSGVTPGNTYWMSHLVNRGNIPGAGGDGYVLSGFGNNVAPARGATSGFLEGAFVGFSQDSANPSSFGDLVIRSRTTAAQSAEDTVLVDGAISSTFGNTYAVIIKAEVDAAGSQDRISWWLNPQNFASEALLTSSSAASGSFLSFAYPTDGVLDRLNYVSYQWNGNAFFDGVRLADDLSGLGGAVPEPSSIVMTLAAAIGCFAGARRRTVSCR